MIKNDEDRLIGMWRHEPTNTWEIKYQKGGKKHSEYRRSKVAAEQRASYWKSVLGDGASHVPPAEDNTHPVLFWERKLREAANHILANPGDEEALDLGKTIAQMATAGMRAANYLPPPTAEIGAGGKPVMVEDIKNMTTEELNSLIESKEK